jgi:hypothetical protein
LKEVVQHVNHHYNDDAGNKKLYPKRIDVYEIKNAEQRENKDDRPDYIIG